MDSQKFGDSYDFVKSVPRQSVLPVLLPHSEMLPKLQHLGSTPASANSGIARSSAMGSPPVA